MNNPFVVPLDPGQQSDDSGDVRSELSILAFTSGAMRLGQVVATLGREVDVVVTERGDLFIGEDVQSSVELFEAAIPLESYDYIPKEVKAAFVARPYRNWTGAFYIKHGTTELPWPEEPLTIVAPRAREVLDRSYGVGEGTVPQPLFSSPERYERRVEHLERNAPPRTPEIDIDLLFDLLADLWLDRTRFESSLMQALAHPAYQQIIKLGAEIVPKLLERLEDNSDRWIPALRAVTGENPVPRGASRDEAVRTWREWAQGEFGN